MQQAKSDASPHLEHGGEKEVQYFSMQAKEGILFEYFDENSS